MAKGDFEVECNVCHQRLKNWIGSTPCCGSLASLVGEDGKTTRKVALYTSVGAAIIDLSEKKDEKP